MTRKVATKSDLKKSGVTRFIGNTTLENMNGGICTQYMCEVDLMKIEVDGRYQRPRSKAQIKNIVNHFDIRAARPLALCYRDGKLWAYDGQQTLNALILCSYTKHTATILSGITFEDECKLFYYLNDIPKKMSGWTKFSAAAMGGQAGHIQLLEKLDEKGITTPLSPNVHQSKYADINSSSILFYAMKNGGIRRVEQLCDILNKCWRVSRKGLVQEGAKKVTVLRGLINFLKDHEDIPFKTIIMILKKTTADELQQLANKQESKGRIDATQVKNALASMFVKKSSLRIAA